MDKQLLLAALIGSLVLVISVFASKATARLGFPILLIFIGIGMILGSEGMGVIHFSNYAATNLLGTLALIFILFSGGLSSLPNLVRPVWKEGVTLATVGVLITTLLMTCLIHFTMGWNWTTAAMLSAAVSSTDAPAIFGILRTQKVEIHSKMRSLVELESGSNDPMAVVLLLMLIQFASAPGEATTFLLIRQFFIQLILGGVFGFSFGKGLVKVINWLKLEFEGLYPVLTMAVVIGVYAATEYLGGNGYLAVFSMGFVMSGEKFVSRKSLLVFHDGLSWLMQVGMFLTLGLLVNPSELSGVMNHAFVFALGLMFIARPLAVALCLIPLGYRSWKEIAFVSWAGMKGAVAIILAIYLFLQRVPHATVMFNVTFFIVILSLLLQGSTIRWVTRALGLCQDREEEDFYPYEGSRKNNEFIEFEVPPYSSLVGQTVFDLKLPPEVLVVLIHRAEEDFIPHGNTELQAHDRLVCLIDRRSIPEIRQMLEGSQTVH